MKESDVINWLIEELTTTLSNSSLVSLSSPGQHVDVVNGRDPPRYPFVGLLQISNTPTARGIGNTNIVVDSLSYDVDGILDSITYRRDNELRIEMVPVTDDDAKLRDDLFTLIEDELSMLSKTGSFPDDMNTPEVDTSDTRDRSNDFIRSDGIPVTIPYSRYMIDSDPEAAETVNVDIDVGDDEDWTNDMDSFDETFS